MINDPLGLAKQHEQNWYIFLRSYCVAVMLMFLCFLFKRYRSVSFKYYMFNSLPMMVNLVVDSVL